MKKLGFWMFLSVCMICLTVMTCLGYGESAFAIVATAGGITGFCYALQLMC